MNINMFEKLNIFKRISDLEKHTDLLEAQISRYEKIEAEYEKNLMKIGESTLGLTSILDRLIGYNRRLAQTCIDHVKSDDSSVRRMTNTLDAIDLSLPEGLTMVEAN